MPRADRVALSATAAQVCKDWSALVRLRSFWKLVLVERVVSPRWRDSASLGVLGNELFLRHLKRSHVAVNVPPGLGKPFVSMTNRVTSEMRKMVDDANPSIAPWACDIRFADDESLKATAHVAMMTGNGGLVRLVFDYPASYPFDQPTVRIQGSGVDHPCIVDGRFQPFDPADWTPLCDTSSLVVIFQEMLNDARCVSFASGASPMSNEFDPDLLYLVEERIGEGAARALVASAGKESLLRFVCL